MKLVDTQKEVHPDETGATTPSIVSVRCDKNENHYRCWNNKMDSNCILELERRQKKEDIIYYMRTNEIHIAAEKFASYKDTFLNRHTTEIFNVLLSAYDPEMAKIYFPDIEVDRVEQSKRQVPLAAFSFTPTGIELRSRTNILTSVIIEEIIQDNVHSASFRYETNQDTIQMSDKIEIASYAYQKFDINFVSYYFPGLPYPTIQVPTSDDKPMVPKPNVRDLEIVTYSIIQNVMDYNIAQAVDTYISWKGHFETNQKEEIATILQHKLEYNVIDELFPGLLYHALWEDTEDEVENSNVIQVLPDIVSDESSAVSITDMAEREVSYGTKHMDRCDSFTNTIDVQSDAEKDEDDTETSSDSSYELINLPSDDDDITNESSYEVISFEKESKR